MLGTADSGRRRVVGPFRAGYPDLGTRVIDRDIEHRTARSRGCSGVGDLISNRDHLREQRVCIAAVLRAALPQPKMDESPSNRGRGLALMGSMVEKPGLCRDSTGTLVRLVKRRRP
jgi:hypothetical protein